MNQFKRIAAALLSGVLLCGALPASTVVWAVGNDSILQDNQTSYAVGDTFDDGVLTYTITGAATVSVTDCTLGASYVNIGEKISGYTITGIGNGAFEGMESMASVTIPKSVTTIEDGAFNGCTGLTSITLPDSVTKIPAGCFQGCSSLQEIKLGSQVTEIGDMAFALCTSLETFTFPETVTAVGLKLFFGCAKLQEVTLPESLTTLGTQMFFSCPALESITIPASVEDVGVMAFSGCTGLKEIVVADGNEYFTVHEGALFDKNLEVLYCYPAAQTETSYTVPDSTLVIGPSAFMCAASLTQVTLPEKLRYIGDGAFYGCVGLSSIILPEAVTTIGDNAFDSCSALQTVTFVGADAEEQTGEDLSIGSYAFFACPKLLDVTLPKRVSSIGSYAFGCTEETDSANTANAAGDEIAVKAVSGFVLSGYTGTASDYVKNCDVKISFHALNFNWKSFVFWVVLGAAGLIILLLAVRVIRRNMLTPEEREALKKAQQQKRVPLSQREQASDAEEKESDDGYQSILGKEDEDEDESASPTVPVIDSVAHGMTHFRGHADADSDTESAQPAAEAANQTTESK